MTNAVANTILSQLGAGHFIAMTGAKNLVAGENMLQFSIGRGASNKANKVRITLTEQDDYCIEFYRWSAKKLEATLVDTAEGVYADSLRHVFTSRTGFDTSM